MLKDANATGASKISEAARLMRLSARAATEALVAWLDSDQGKAERGTQISLMLRDEAEAIMRGEAV